METIKQYTFCERLKYAQGRDWFCRQNGVPVVPSDLDIHLDWIWRDLMQQNRRRETLNNKSKELNYGK